MSPDQIVERRAARRFGIISATDALQAGMTRRMIRRREATGRWLRLFTDVFRIAAVPDTWEGRLTAAQEWIGSDTVFSHRTAAALYGLDGIPGGHVDLTAPTTKTDPRIVVHRLRGPRLAARSVKGFPVTTVERTLLDLCAVLPPVRCGKAIDDALRRRLTTLDRLNATLTEARGRTGVAVFRRLLSFRDDRDGKVASELETRLLRILKTIPDYRFIPQFPVADGTRKYYLDFGFPDQMVAVEGHSIRWHLGEDAFKSDVRRDRRLSLLGWTVLYFLWDEVWFEPIRVASEVRDALRSVQPNDRNGHFTGRMFG